MSLILFQLLVRPQQGDLGVEEGRLQGQDQVGHHPVFAGRLEGGAERNIRPGYLDAISSLFFQRVVVVAKWLE